MKVHDILDQFEQQKVEQKLHAELEKRKASEHRKQIAESLQKFLLETVKPIFDQYEEVLSARNYTAMVGVDYQTDTSVEKNTEVAISIKLETNVESVKTYMDSFLQYLGNFNEETIVRKHKIGSSGMIINRPAMPFNDLTEEVIQNDVDTFLSAVFKVKK